MDIENRYATRGVGGTALGLSIGALALMALGGGIGNLLGGFRPPNNGGSNSGDMAMAASLLTAINGIGNHSCGDGYVTTREAALTREIADKDSRIGHLESTIYTDSKIADVYERLNTKIGVIEAQIGQQAVYNATNSSVLGCLQGQVASLMALTKTVIPIDSICPTPAVATT